MLLTGFLGSLSRTVGNGCSRLSPLNLLRPKRFNSDLNLFKSRAGIKRPLSLAFCFSCFSYNIVADS